MQRREQPVPPVVFEVLRFCVVVFLASAGYAVARGFGATDVALGPFEADGIGLLLGAAVGYVAGGVVSRLTFRSVSAAETALSGRSAEQLLAGVLGAVVAVLTATALAWPMLLLGQLQYTAPPFVFVIVTVGILGYRLGLSRRDGMLTLFSGRGGLAARPQSTAALPRVVDTSVAIDGRIVDVVRAGFLHGTLLVAQPVVDELQAFADAGDDQRRAKGRRGLEVLETLQREPGVLVELVPDPAVDVESVDSKLVRLSLQVGGALLTLDTGLAGAAKLAGARVMNLHALALALRPPVVAGERVTVHLTRPGKEAHQAVGYLDDGTMVVVEAARALLGRDADVTVVSVLVTANGRMIFGRLETGTTAVPVAVPVPMPVPAPVPVPVPVRVAVPMPRPLPRPPSAPAMLPDGRAGA